ncbi:MAG: aspartate aminotransferase family protein [Lachnospiraceae bacterium]
MSFINNSEIKREDILEKSLKHWNPGKTQEWIERGMDIVMGKREGYCFWDVDGRKWLNIHINGGTYNLGHRNPEVVQALVDATQELDVGNHHFTGITKALLAEQLTSLCPEGLDYACFSTCGGEAIDVAIKSARYATKRKRVVTLQGCYHGHTGLSVSTGDPLFKDPFLCDEPDNFVQVPRDDLDAMEAELKKEDVACVIMESILATYGFPMPATGYQAAVKKLCEKYGTLYVSDETQTGLMRTGKMWNFEHEGFVPDMITSAKGFGGGVYPISATVMNRKAASWMFDIGRLHGSTCGGSEIGCAVAMKVLEITTRPETVALVNKNTKILTERVDALCDKYNGFLMDYSQRGVIMGLNFNCKDASRTVAKPLFDCGVWAHNSRLHPNTLQLKLGLLCDDAFMDELFEKMDEGIALAISRKSE